MSKKELIQFLLFLIVVSFVLWLLESTYPKLIDPNIWQIHLILTTITVISRRVLALANGKEPDWYPTMFMAGTVIRMLLALVTIAIYVVVIAENPFLIGVNFICLYFCYLAFEIYALITNLRPRLKKG